MEAQWMADRAHLRTLLATRPDWTQQDLADAIGRSLGWVKKWVKRLRGAAPDDETILRSRSRARKQPPPAVSQVVIDRILELRDHPPHGLQRIPGPKAIQYYLTQDTTLQAVGVRLPRSTRTIWRILTQHQRILQPKPRRTTALERPAPLTSWQLDFKDASTVPADPEGKQRHVVEVLNTVDVGTSILLKAQARTDFTAATTIAAVAEVFREHGLPAAITVDRDPRFVGSTKQRDCPSPFIRFCLCLGVQVTLCPPRRPDLNGFVERYHRSYQEECLAVYRPADLEAVTTVTAAFHQHYNYTRPHQGLTCANQPPRAAFPVLPARPSLPATVDPDGWVDVLDGRRYVRKVAQDTSVSIDEVRYYLSQALVGQSVALRVDAAQREFVVEHEGCEVKRMPIQGVGSGPVPFATFLERMVDEARTDQQRRSRFSNQLPFSF